MKSQIEEEVMLLRELEDSIEKCMIPNTKQLLNQASRLGLGNKKSRHSQKVCNVFAHLLVSELAIYFFCEHRLPNLWLEEGIYATHCNL